MTAARLGAWAADRPARSVLLGWLACALLAALFLAPALARGAFGPGDLLLSMTPWSLYRERFPDVVGVHNPQLDVIQQYFPWRMFAAETLRQGILPLWNPHAYSGQPFVANVLSAVFYPVTWIAVVLPIGAFFLVSTWLHLTLLGGGMWMLLRDHGLRARSAFCGSAVMMLNGFVVGWLAFPNVSQWTFAWLPLLFWAWRRAWLPRRPARLGWTALLLALVLLGGHLQIALYVWTAWGLYAAGSVLLDRRPGALLGYVAAPALLGGLLGAVQVLPALELASASGRGARDYADIGGGTVPPGLLITLLVPHFFGHNALDLVGSGSGGVYWGPYINAIEASGSIGAAATLLALVALVWGRRSAQRARAVGLFGGIALLGVLLSMQTPLHWLFWQLVPGFDALTGFGRGLCLWCFGVAALAGFGVEALSEPRDRGPRGSLLAGVLAGGVAAALLLAFVREALATTGPESMTALNPLLSGYVLGQVAIAVVAAAAVLVPVAMGGRRLAWLAAAGPLLELFVLGFGLHRGAPPEVFFFDTPETEFLAAADEPFRFVGVAADPRRPFLDWMPMNTPLAYGLSSPTGSESLSFALYRRLHAIVFEESWYPRLEHPLIDRLGVRYALSRADLEAALGWPRVGGERVGVYANPEALPLLFGAPSWRVVRPGALWDELARPERDAREVLLAAPPPGEVGPPRPPGPGALPAQPVTSADPVPYSMASPSPQRWVGAGSPTRPVLVTLAVMRAPGWRVWVDQREAVGFAADAVFQAVLVGPSERVVRWVYAPLSFRVGLFASLLAAAALVGYAAFAGYAALAGLAVGGRRRWGEEESARERVAAGATRPGAAT